MAITLDYEKLKSDRNITVWGGPSGDSVGISNAAVPTAAEINDTGGVSGLLNWSPSISWNDFDFGIEESETLSDPSLADESTSSEFGAQNYGGGMSFYYPREYDDNSNNHSLVYDQTDTPWTPTDIAQRIDGAKQNNTAAADGDFVHVFRTMTDSEQNVLQSPDAYRRTVGFLSQGDAAFYTIVGAHTITAAEPGTYTVGDTGRIRGIVQDRDYTNALRFSSSDADVIDVHPGGFYEVTGTGTATVTITDEGAGTSTTVSVTAA